MFRKTTMAAFKTVVESAHVGVFLFEYWRQILKKM